MHISKCSYDFLPSFTCSCNIVNGAIAYYGGWCYSIGAEPAWDYLQTCIVYRRCSSNDLCSGSTAWRWLIGVYQVVSCDHLRKKACHYTAFGNIINSKSLYLFILPSLMNGLVSLTHVIRLVGWINHGIISVFCQLDQPCTSWSRQSLTFAYKSRYIAQ